MMVNTYDFTVEDETGKKYDISLRLGIGAQIKLKKKWNESTTQTLFSAADDIERLADVMTKALDWKGNQNEIHDGEELLDLMAENGMLGMAEKQHVVTSLGVASGLFSEEEKKKIDKRADHMFDDVLEDGELDEKSKPGKNR